MNRVGKCLLFGRLRASRHVVSCQLLNRRLLLHVVETEMATFQSYEGMVSTLLPLRAIRDLPFRTCCRDIGEMAVGGPLELQAIPRLLWQREGDGLAPFNVHVPVGQLVVVMPSGQA